jgi:hypothetical protein
LPFAAQLAGDAQILWPDDESVADLLFAVPGAPEVGVSGRLPEALDRLGELALERDAAHLAVGDDPEARLFLEPHGFVHGPILYPLELRGGDLIRGVALAGSL